MSNVISSIAAGPKRHLCRAPSGLPNRGWNKKFNKNKSTAMRPRRACGPVALPSIAVDRSGCDGGGRF
jgi:hypothetical protein